MLLSWRIIKDIKKNEVVSNQFNTVNFFKYFTVKIYGYNLYDIVFGIIYYSHSFSQL